MRRRALLFALLITRLSFSVGAQTVEDLDAKIGPAVTALRNALVQKNPDGKELTVATVPLVDEQGRIRKMGVVAAQIVERQLVAGKPDWLRVQTRINLTSLQDEQKLWITNLVRESGKETATPTHFLEKADFLVVGSVNPDPRQVTIELRLITTRTGNVLDAQSAKVPLSASVREMLKFLQRGPDPDGRELAKVSEIRFTISAQRAERPGTPVREWTVAEGATLKGGSDQFQVRFAADADACVYLFLYGSDNQAALLFPTDDWDAQFERQFSRKARPQDNFCRAELEYAVPGADVTNRARFFKLDTTPGTNTLYLCANRTEIRNPQDAVKRLNEATSADERKKILTDTFRFDCVETFSFRQDSGK